MGALANCRKRILQQIQRKQRGQIFCLIAESMELLLRLFLCTTLHIHLWARQAMAASTSCSTWRANITANCFLSNTVHSARS